MMELIAQGTEADYRWRRQVPTDTPFELGRSTPSFRVPWDRLVSRRHARLKMIDQKILVQKLENASNPIFYNGGEQETFTIEPGEHFVIGNTTFTLTQDQALATLDLPSPISQKSFSQEFLRQIPYRDAGRRMDVLNRLPDVIASTPHETDLIDRLLNLLLMGIPSASAIGLVQRVPEGLHPVATDAMQPKTINIIHWDRRDGLGGDFQPSVKLICQAIDMSESVLHIWQPASVMQAEYTFDLENDWAFVCPIDSEATPGWGIYVTGSSQGGSSAHEGGSDAADLQGDIKFCELIGTSLKNLMHVKQLEQRQAGLRGFFSPVVLDVLAGQDPETVLAPQQCQVSVMFCDLRGFSQTSESMSDDLFQLLHRVSQSLDIMTGKILQYRGVIGDFHGDSAMGFWGWPLPQEDTALRAIQAALAIKSEFHHRADQAANFRVGIGIATGSAVAGKIGSKDQVKVTVFGPVVNLASRMEGMNRWFGSSILIDRNTRDQLILNRPDNKIKTRCLGLFQPFGMTTPCEIFEVLDRNDPITPETLALFETARQAFHEGDWSQAYRQLLQLPEHDQASRFLLDTIEQQGTRLDPSDGPPEKQPADANACWKAPDDWDGVIRMQSK